MKFLIRDYVAIIAVLLVLVMTVLDGTVVNVALPVLASEFGVSDSVSVWVVTSYQLVITMLLLPFSLAGDLYGYRRVFLWGVVIFTVGSCFCALSQSFGLFIASRCVQGLGAACVMGVNIALTRQIYPQRVLSRGLALNAMVIAVSTAAGPTISGALLSVVSWHWLFIVNLPFGVCAYFVGRRYLPENSNSAGNRKYDWLGAFLNAAFFGLLILALGNFSRGEGLVVNLTLLGIGLLCGALYFRRESRIALPMLPVDLFRIRLFSMSIFTSMCSFVGQNSAMVALPFLLMNGCGFPVSVTGLLMTPWPLATMIISPFAARLAERFSAGLVAATGMFVFASGLISLMVLPLVSSGVVDVAWRMLLCGVGFGLYQTPNNIVMVSATPFLRSGSAGGMQGTSRLIGQTLGATLVSLVFVFSASGVSGARSSLGVSIFFAVVAGIFSIVRVSGRESSAV